MIICSKHAHGDRVEQDRVVVIEIDRRHERVAGEALAVSGGEVEVRREVGRRCRRLAEQGRELTQQGRLGQSQLDAGAVRSGSKAALLARRRCDGGALGITDDAVAADVGVELSAQRQLDPIVGAHQAGGKLDRRTAVVNVAEIHSRRVAPLSCTSSALACRGAMWNWYSLPCRNARVSSTSWLWKMR